MSVVKDATREPTMSKFIRNAGMMTLTAGFFFMAAYNPVFYGLAVFASIETARCLNQ